MQYLKNILKSLVFGVLFLALFGSCASLNNKKNRKEKIPLKSFVQVKYKSYRKICTPRDPKNYKSSCYLPLGGGVGSGVIFAHSLEGSYIMTAAHVCDPERIPEWMHMHSMPEAENEELRKNIIKVFSINDYNYFSHNLEIVDFDRHTDLCVGHVWGLFDRRVRLSKRRPKLGEKVINIAAPAGFFSSRVVPVLDGRFSGNTMIERKARRAVYTIPAVGGSSGSPVLTVKGKLIGMISAAHVRFHHIALSPVYRDVIDYLINTVKKDTEKKGRDIKDIGLF